MHQTTNLHSLAGLAVHLPGAATACEITLAGGRIAALTPVSRPAEAFLMPPLVDLHLHANRAYSLEGNVPASFDDAVAIALRSFDEATFKRYFGQCARLYAALARSGTARARTHADVDPVLGTLAVEASVAAAAAQPDVAIDVVAFASGRCDPRTAQGRALLLASVAAGAKFIGAVPCFFDDPGAVIDAALAIARDAGVPADFHLDEHLDPDWSFSRRLAEAVLDAGMAGQVALGHGCAMGELEPAERATTFDLLGRAEITVITLPTTNLYLQGREISHPRLRGLAPVKEMLEAGLKVRAASDNVQDAFYPYGDADLMTVAELLVIAGQIDDERQIAAMLCDGQTGVSVGDPADFVLFDAPSLRGLVGRKADRVRYRAD